MKLWNSIPRDKHIKLQTVCFKHDTNDAILGGIQLKFTHGVESPLFATAKACNKELKSAHLDTSKKITQVAMYLNSSNSIYRMRMLDKNGLKLIDIVFNSYQHKDCLWTVKDIPDEQEIIGLYCNTSNNPYYIQSLGFILWTPPTN